MFRACLIVAILLQISTVAAQCPSASLDAVKNFEIEKYVGNRWYSLRQLPVAYQPKDQFNCVFAEYAVDTSKSLSCRLFGWIFGCNDPQAISVFNSARDGSSTGRAVSVNFKATVPDSTNDPAKAFVGPKFLPNLARQDTNYWVVAVGTFNDLAGLEALPESDIYEWAIITSGPAEIEGANDLCYSGGGMWYFSRTPTPPAGTEEALTALALGLKLDPAVLEPVNQSGCDYENGEGKFLSGFITLFQGLF